ncbi:hypothetical protein Cni_G03624 [Canna indica]|uniref:Uncharacterized protein n=1 Tax=Canna indica TaxID=4628 RepID=A0AAQ3JTW2_9LILI|nr:hypothetical protein Cni_G03624 [Canna indica]
MSASRRKAHFSFWVIGRAVQSGAQGFWYYPGAKNPGVLGDLTEDPPVPFFVKAKCPFCVGCLPNVARCLEHPVASPFLGTEFYKIVQAKVCNQLPHKKKKLHLLRCKTIVVLGQQKKLDPISREALKAHI